MARIGIFGGTFDPPHIGHQILAAEALEQAKLDFIYWVLTPNPPHKTGQTITGLADRLSMVELAIAGNPNFLVSRVDIDRDPPHYAVETMSILIANAPQDKFYYLMGMDSLGELLTWHAPADFVKLCRKILVIRRPGENLDIAAVKEKIPGLEQKVEFLNTPMIEISSTEVRRRIQLGLQYRYYVPDKIFQYISEKKLYLPNSMIVRNF